MFSEEKLKTFGTLIFLFFGAAIYIAKPPINISWGILCLITLVYLVFFYRKNLFSQNAWVLILVLPVAVGFIASFFSLTGPKASIAFMSRYRFLLLPLPFFLFVTDRKTLIRLFILMNAAALFDVGYCYYTSAGSDSLFYNFYGLHKFGRNSDMLFCLCLFNTGILIGGRKLSFFRDRTGIYFLLAIHTIILVASVALLGERGAWLGLLAGLIVYLLAYSRKILIVLAILFPLLLLNLPQGPQERLIGQHSTHIRMKLYTLAPELIIDKGLWFRGTGAKASDKFVREYIAQQPEAYQENYNYILEHFPDNFHSSFLQMAVEGGLIFPALFLGAAFFLLFRLFKARPMMTPEDSLVVWTAISVTCGSFTSQMFHEELFRYGGLVALIILYTACFIETSYRSPELSSPVFGNYDDHDG